MIELKQILLDQMTEDDRKWLEKGCYGCFEKNNPVDQIDAVKRGDAWMFRLSGDVEGLFVLAKGNTHERELVMTAIAGKNILKNLPEVYRKIRELARSVGTRRLIGYVTRPGLAAVYNKRTTAKPVATIFEEKLT